MLDKIIRFLNPKKKKVKPALKGYVIVPEEVKDVPKDKNENDFESIEL